jgi:erythromycin esterase-like protein
MRAGRTPERLVMAAQSYYDEFLTGGVTSWNIRDRHMAESVKTILSYYDVRYGTRSKIIICPTIPTSAMRATEMADTAWSSRAVAARTFPRGQDRRLRFLPGRAIAAKYWDGSMDEFRLPAAQEGSWEHLLSQAGEENKIIALNEAFRAWG